MVGRRMPNWSRQEANCFCVNTKISSSEKDLRTAEDESSRRPVKLYPLFWRFASISQVADPFQYSFLGFVIAFIYYSVPKYHVSLS